MAMNKKIIFGRSIKDILLAAGPSFLLLIIACGLAYKFMDPAPPNHMVITTGEGEGDYEHYASLYKEILKEDGVTLEIRKSSGAMQNLKELDSDDSDVDVGFMQDGLGSTKESPDLLSLGSLYYEPIWIFYRGKKELTKITQLEGLRIGIGRANGGTRLLSLKLLGLSGLDHKNSNLINIGDQNSADAIKRGELDVAIFLATPDDAIIEDLASDPNLKLMNLDQAEAITRQIPFLHHLILPHGAIDLKNNIPAQDVHLISPTATLVARDTLHPALAYLLLQAIAQVHSEPGLLEVKNEFPNNKNYLFPLSDEAKYYYKSGTPFWQRYLPFWIATLVDRFILLVIPILALVLPLIRLIPKIYTWRIRTRIFKRYGELKFLETQIKPQSLRLSIWII